MNRQYTARERTLAIRMRGAGASDADIAAAVGRSRASVSVHLCRWRRQGLDVPVARRGRSVGYGTAHRDVDAVRDLRSADVPVKTVARLLGLTPAAVAYRAKLGRMEART